MKNYERLEKEVNEEALKFYEKKRTFEGFVPSGVKIKRQDITIKNGGFWEGVPEPKPFNNQHEIVYHCNNLFKFLTPFGLDLVPKP